MYVLYATKVRQAVYTLAFLPCHLIISAFSDAFALGHCTYPQAGLGRLSPEGRRDNFFSLSGPRGVATPPMGYFVDTIIFIQRFLTALTFLSYRNAAVSTRVRWLLRHTRGRSGSVSGPWSGASPSASRESGPRAEDLTRAGPGRCRPPEPVQWGRGEGAEARSLL